METRDIALIKALSNGAGGASYTLPVASSSQLGGVQPVAKTDAMTQSVGVDETGALFTEPGSSGGGGTETWRTVVDLEISENDVARIDISVDGDGKPFSLKKFIVLFPNKWTASTAGYLRFNDTPVWIASLFQNSGYRMTKIIGDFSSGQLMFTAVYSTNTASSAAQFFASTNPNGQTAYNQIEGTALTSLSIYPQGTNTLAAGTKLKLIGVDAM